MTAKEGGAHEPTLGYQPDRARVPQVEVARGPSFKGSTVAQFWGRLFHCETSYWSFAYTIKLQISAFGIWEALLKQVS